MGVVSYKNYKNKKEEIKKLQNKIEEKNNQIYENDKNKKKEIKKLQNQINENDKNKKEEITKLQNQIIEKNIQIEENYYDFQRLDTENSQLKKEKNNLNKEIQKLSYICEQKQILLINELNLYKEENKNLKNKIDNNEIYSLFENQMITRIDYFLNNNCKNIQEIIEKKFKNYFKNVKFEMENEIINILNKENINNFFENKIKVLSSIIKKIIFKKQNI